MLKRNLKRKLRKILKKKTQIIKSFEEKVEKFGSEESYDEEFEDEESKDEERYDEGIKRPNLKPGLVLGFGQFGKELLFKRE